MLPLAHIGLSSSGRAGLRAAFVVLTWLALWFSVFVAALQRPETPSSADARIEVTVSPQA
jgi:hypothetical protein